ncbi:aquaporin [Candidatus Micrarchaeota archaeon]|nr:aquaporin [Candidatus Micrarchaeota archaeon]
MKDLKLYVSEFLGTFGLVFIGAGAVLVNGLTGGSVGLVGIAFAHGLILMAMIYSMGSISGAHFNPAVTLAMLINKRIDVKKAALYIVSQLLGASVAAFLLKLIFPVATSAQLYGFPIGISLATGIALEAVLTFFLVFVIYGTAVSKKAVPGVFGFAIGSSVALDIMMGGNITGAAMNPARAFGPAVVSGLFSDLPIYIIGPIIGAIVASVLCEWLHKE